MITSTDCTAQHGACAARARMPRTLCRRRSQTCFASRVFFDRVTTSATCLISTLPADFRDALIAVDREAARSLRVREATITTRLRRAPPAHSEIVGRPRRPGEDHTLGAAASALIPCCFRAIGGSPPIGVLVLGYLIGQLGGNLPLPGGLGGIEGGLVGTFALYHQPVVQATAAVLVYHAISLWVPALLGSAALRSDTRRVGLGCHSRGCCLVLGGAGNPRSRSQ